MRSRSILMVLPAWLSAMCATSLADAQERTGRLIGRVITEEDAGVPGATIALAGPAATRIAVRSDDRGYFAVFAVTPGEYDVRVRAPGYREVVVEHVIVQLGQATALGDVLMRVAAVSLSPMVVRYDPARLDPLSTAISTSLAVRAAEALPIGRDLTSMVLLMPQAQESPIHQESLNIAGGTGFENAIYVDGINVTEGFRHNGGISLPPSFIDHVELKTGGYEPEFGRATGGIINMTTRGGTNVPWLSAFSYYSTNALASSATRSAFDVATGRFARYDVGVAAAGPIARDRLWYFAAYDAAVTQTDLRMPGGAQTDHTRADRFAAKLAWRADARTNVAVTVVGDPSRRDLIGNAFWGGPSLIAANPEPFLGFWNQGGEAASLAATRTLGTRWLLEASVTGAWFSDRTGPRAAAGVTQPLAIDFVTGEWSGGHGNRWDRHGTRTAAAFAASYVRGEHMAKIGAQFEENDQRESWQWPGNGPGGSGVVFRTGDAEYIALALDLRTRTRVRVPTLYAQTSILALPRLRVNGGVRWETEQFSSATTGRSGSIPNELQPRLGVILYPTGERTQKLTASVGRYYEQLPSQPITWYWGGLKQRVFISSHDPRVDPSGVATIALAYMPASGLRGQHYDEITVGYERTLLGSLAFAARGSYRALREVLEEIVRSDSLGGDHVLANPGRGEFTALARPNTRYRALELSLSRLGAGGDGFMLSYVLSRRYGNYVGVRDQDSGNPNAQAALVSDFTGLLPNDRTHVLKGFAVLRVRRDVTIGATVAAMSGTPLSDFGKKSPDPGSAYPLGKRGAAGRTPFTWDLGLRGTYLVRNGRAAGTRLVVDVLHAFSQRKPVRLDEVRFLGVDANGNPTTPNPFHHTGLEFQPPMTLRIGVELGGGPRAGAGQ